MLARSHSKTNLLKKTKNNNLMVGTREDASRVRLIQHQDEYHGADRVDEVYKLVKRRKFRVRQKLIAHSSVAGAACNQIEAIGGAFGSRHCWITHC
jgi:hypothetical protein